MFNFIFAFVLVCVNAAALVSGYKMICSRLDKMQTALRHEVYNDCEIVKPVSPVETAAAPAAAEPAAESEAAPVEEAAAVVTPKPRKSSAKHFAGEVREDGKVFTEYAPGKFGWRSAKGSSSVTPNKAASSDVDNNETAAPVQDEAPAENTPAKDDTPKHNVGDVNDKGLVWTEYKAGKFGWRKPKAEKAEPETPVESCPEFETAGQHDKKDLIEMTMKAFKGESIMIESLGVTFNAGATQPVIIEVIKKDGVLVFTHMNTTGTKVVEKVCSMNFVKRDTVAAIYEAVVTTVKAAWYEAHPAAHTA